MARILYEYPTSPFSRRTRLALAHKSLPYERRDARADPALLDEARKKTPLKTIPILVEPDGRALGDSTAIVHYLDHAYPEAPPLWPTTDAALVFEAASLVDAALNMLVDLGTRYYPLRDSPEWPTVKAEMLGRVQRALDALGERVAQLGRATIAKSGWSAADAWVYTAVAWLEGLPARAATNANVAQVLSLGWTLPDPLVRWADHHRGRADVKALDA